MSNKYLYSFAVLVLSSLILESSLSADEVQDKQSYYNGKRSATTTIDISGLDKKQLLLALWDNALGRNLSENKFIGNTILPVLGNLRPTEKEIITALAGGRIDRLGGRVLKVDLSGDLLNPFLYDRDNGTGAALAAISGLRKEQN